MVPNLSDPDLPARILVVEDDAGMRTLILRALQGGGFRARGVASGDEMWAALEVAPVDLIILDIMLPGTNGIELCRALRNGQGPVMLTKRPLAGSHHHGVCPW